MCKSKALGGQRCSGHALIALQIATAKYEASPTLTNYETVLDRQAAFASTPSGAHVLREAVLTAEDEGNQQEADNIARVLEKGALIRERNKAIETAMKAPWTATHDEEDHQLLVAAMKTSNIATATEVARGLFATKGVQPAASTAKAPTVDQVVEQQIRARQEERAAAQTRPAYAETVARLAATTSERARNSLRMDSMSSVVSHAATTVGAREVAAWREEAARSGDFAQERWLKRCEIKAASPVVVRSAPTTSTLGSWGEYVPASFQH